MSMCCSQVDVRNSSTGSNESLAIAAHISSRILDQRPHLFLVGNIGLVEPCLTAQLLDFRDRALAFSNVDVANYNFGSLFGAQQRRRPRHTCRSTGHHDVFILHFSNVLSPFADVSVDSRSKQTGTEHCN